MDIHMENALEEDFARRDAEEAAHDAAMEELEAECLVCGEDNMPMGILGNLAHYRCRNCGITYSKHLGGEA